MIDATQLPRVSRKAAGSTGSDVVRVSEIATTRAGQGDEASAGRVQLQGYPAKDLVLENGRYRAVDIDR